MFLLNGSNIDDAALPNSRDPPRYADEALGPHHGVEMRGAMVFDRPDGVGTDALHRHPLVPVAFPPVHGFLQTQGNNEGPVIVAHQFEKKRLHD